MSSSSILKRRAIAARLLVCLASVALCGVAAASAAAAPIPPILSGTNPPSSAEMPAASTTPAVLGEAEPIPIEEGFPLGSPPLGAEGRSVPHPTEHPNYTIEIFSGSECDGPLVGTGTAGAFESEGITVTVAQDLKTTLSAKQVDPSALSEPSVCSGSLSYWEGNVPPEAPGSGDGEGGEGDGGGSSSGGDGAGPEGGQTAPGTIGHAVPVSPVKLRPPHIHTNPGGVANSTAPLVIGNAPGAESVLLYTNERCEGAPVAKGSEAQLQAGFQVSVTANAATSFSAAAIIGQRSACSEAVSYVEDSTAPRTRITMAPGVKTRKRKAVFRFKDITEDPPGTTFRCKVDKKKWKPCASPFHVKHLKYGHHVVKIRATDLAGNVERRPVKRRFIVVSAGRA